MVQFIFPFDKVRKGSRVSIWGSGVVGRDYFGQIKALDYCKIISIVDANAIEEGWIVHPIEKLNQDVDYIIIAISDLSVSREIRMFLSKILKISNNKIVSDIRRAQSDIEVSLDEILNGKLWKTVMSDYMENSLGRFEYLHPLTNSLNISRDKNSIKTSVKKEIHNLTVEEQIVTLRMMMLAECFDKELMKLYMSCIAVLKNKELAVFLLYEIVWNEIAHGEYRYENYYNDRRNIIKENTKELLKNKSFEFYKRQFSLQKSIKRICILRPNMPDYTKSSATQLAIDWANEFSKAGCEVLILSTNYLFGLNVVSFIRLQNLQEPFELNEKYLLENVKAETSKGRNIAEKMYYILNRIKDFCPDLIIDTCADYEMLSSILYQYFPIIQIPFRGYNSCTFHHRCILNSKELFELERMKFHSIEEKKVVYARGGLASFIQKSANKVNDVERRKDRAKYDISENSFLLATIGNRLEKELPMEYIDCVINILHKYKEMVWILVGSGTFGYIRQKAKELLKEKRIILWGYENELVSFYKRLDIDLIIYPEISGNAACASYALLSGTPVLAMKNCGDVACVIGRENMVSHNLSVYGKRLEELFCDRLLLKKLYDKEKKYVDIKYTGTMEQHIQKILNVGNEIINEKFIE